jgi:hypothetical protein
VFHDRKSVFKEKIGWLGYIFMEGIVIKYYAFIRRETCELYFFKTFKYSVKLIISG